MRKKKYIKYKLHFRDFNISSFDNFNNSSKNFHWAYFSAYIKNIRVSNIIKFKKALRKGKVYLVIRK